MKYTWPSDEQWESFQKAFSPSEKVIMLNLLKFRESADYRNFPNETPCSGREAFARYETHVIPCIESYGGRFIFSENAKGSVIGPEGENWDKVILVEYPSAQALGEMVASEKYQSFVHHRAAATEDSRLIPTQAAGEHRAE